MRKNKLIKYLYVTSIIIVAIFFINKNNSYALEDVDNYSELYKQYLELSDEEKEKATVIPEKYNVSLKEYNESNNNSTSLSKNSSKTPETYSLAEHYDIKVENQGQEGNCWAFASLETLETYLQIHGLGTFDFSENHLNYIESNLFSETDAGRKINSAGNYSEFQEYVSKKLGPVSEEDYPYYKNEETSIYKDYKPNELDELLNVEPLAYVGEYVSFPSVNKENNQYSDSELSEYRDGIKKHIMENGAVYTLVTAPNYFTGEFYNQTTFSAYFPTTNDDRFTKYAHAVAIIGWDDNYSKENFLDVNKPEHDGAYIILNSWGSNFGDSGLYYISYDDAFVEQNLRGIKEAVTDISQLSNTKSFTIKDSNLYNALKDFLGRKITSYDDSSNQITILSGMINEITYMNLVDYNITDLSGLENFVNLASLNLSHNNISSIEPLLALHNLSDIDLRYNEFTSIPAELNNAELSSLALSYNPIEDFSGIADIKSVANLDLEGTNVKESDLVFLKNLKINTLNLSKTNIKDYSTLKTINDGAEQDEGNIYNLQQLCANYNDDIIYSSLPSVYDLNLSHTNLDEDKFNQIENLSNIQLLDISYTNIKNLGILSECHLNSINISGNRDLQDIDVLKNTRYIDYCDAGLSDIFIFNGFNSGQLNLTQNEIADYSDLLENENLNYVDLSNNKINTVYYSDRLRVCLDGNNIKPIDINSDCIDSMKNQKYSETLRVDSSRENIFKDIGIWLKELYNSGTKLNISNATMDYENDTFEISDYDKDVVIKIGNGIYEGSTITYKIEKVDSTSANYIYMDRSNLKTTYIEGENFDATGLKVYAVYDNDSISEINDFTITGGENLQAGSNQITIEKDGLSNLIEVTAISNDDIKTLNFETTEVYEATLKKISNIEKERQQYPEYYDHLQVLISKDDENKIIKILKQDLQWISYLEIISDDAISLEDTKQFPELIEITLNGKNMKDLSVFNYFKELREDREDLLPSEKLMSIQIKNNQAIEKIEDNIYRSVSIENSAINDINNLTNLTFINYKGSEMPKMDDIIDTIELVYIQVASNIEDVQRDDNLNIILPDLLKQLQDSGLEIEANICDQVRDEQYLNSHNRINIPITESEGKLILNYDDIKNIEYEGRNQFIEIKVKDVNNKYFTFNFKYNIKYKLFEHIEIETDEAVELEIDTVPDLSNIKVYKVYSNGEKVQLTDFTYSKDKVTEDLTELEILYSEDGITSTIGVPVNVTEHVHEWGEWIITKEPSETAEGQKERGCLKNKNHKEIVKIDKIPKVEDENVGGESEYTTQTIENANNTNNKENPSDSKKIGRQNKNSENNTANRNKSNINPKTGDNISIWFDIMLLSIMGIFGTFKYLRKRD